MCNPFWSCSLHRKEVQLFLRINFIVWIVISEDTICLSAHKKMEIVLSNLSHRCLDRSNNRKLKRLPGVNYPHPGQNVTPRTGQPEFPRKGTASCAKAPGRTERITSSSIMGAFHHHHHHHRDYHHLPGDLPLLATTNFASPKCPSAYCSVSLG